MAGPGHSLLWWVREELIQAEPQAPGLYHLHMCGAASHDEQGQGRGKAWAWRREHQLPFGDYASCSRHELTPLTPLEPLRLVA